jgi:hypothetical protein
MRRGAEGVVGVAAEWAEKLILFLLFFFFFEDKLWDRNMAINTFLCLCVFSQL